MTESLAIGLEVGQGAPRREDGECRAPLVHSVVAILANHPVLHQLVRSTLSVDRTDGAALRDGGCPTVADSDDLHAGLNEKTGREEPYTPSALAFRSRAFSASGLMPSERTHTVKRRRHRELPQMEREGSRTE